MNCATWIIMAFNYCFEILMYSSCIYAEHLICSMHNFVMSDYVQTTCTISLSACIVHAEQLIFRMHNFVMTDYVQTTCTIFSLHNFITALCRISGTIAQDKLDCETYFIHFHSQHTSSLHRRHNCHCQSILSERHYT